MTTKLYKIKPLTFEMILPSHELQFKDQWACTPMKGVHYLVFHNPERGWFYRVNNGQSKPVGGMTEGLLACKLDWEHFQVGRFLEFDSQRQDFIEEKYPKVLEGLRVEV